MNLIGSPMIPRPGPSRRSGFPGSGFQMDGSRQRSSRRSGSRREFRLRRPRGAGRDGEDGSDKRFDFRRPRRKPPFQLARLIWLVALLVVVIFLIRYFGILSR